MQLYRLQESLDELQSTVVGSLLDFLNKELRRLLEERRAHAICIILERERYDREAAEAGRRQVEVRRRREHDEMFKQIVKIQQETVDMYLEDIIKEGTEFTSDQEAKEYVQRLARKIDEEAQRFKEAYEHLSTYHTQSVFLTYNNFRMYVSMHEEEETVADLVHHFVLPEVEKQLIRQKIQKKQREKLKTIHDFVYSEIEDVQIKKVEHPTSIQRSMGDSEYIHRSVGTAREISATHIAGLPDSSPSTAASSRPQSVRSSV